MRLQRYLINEKTFKITSEVNGIWNRSFKKYIRKWEPESGSPPVYGAGKQIRNLQDVEFGFFMSYELKSNEAKAASLVNPALIRAGVYRSGPNYSITSGKLGNDKFNSMITLSLNYNAVSIMVSGREGQVKPEQFKYSKNEVSEDRIKAMIAHEISHWLNDSLHNWNIRNLVNVALELDKPEMMLMGKENINMTHFEIDALIHGIKQVKSMHKKEWDKFTFKKLREIYTPLWTITNDIRKHPPKVFDVWMRLLVKRMHREKLLGKNMRKFDL